MAVKFVATVSNAEISKCIRAIKTYDGKARLGAEKVLQNATRRIAGGARRRVAVASGTLKKSIKSGFSKSKLVGVVRANAPHAHLVEFGANAAIVKAKKGKALKTVVADGYKYFKTARIPKRKARPFIVPAFNAEAPKIVDELKKELSKRN